MDTMSYKYKLLFEYYYKIELKRRVLAPYHVIFITRKNTCTKQDNDNKFWMLTFKLIELKYPYIDVPTIITIARGTKYSQDIYRRKKTNYIPGFILFSVNINP